MLVTDDSFAHDGSMAPLLGLLQIDQPVWPGMGTEVSIQDSPWTRLMPDRLRALEEGR